MDRSAVTRELHVSAHDCGVIPNKETNLRSLSLMFSSPLALLTVTAPELSNTKAVVEEASIMKQMRMMCN